MAQVTKETGTLRKVQFTILGSTTGRETRTAKEEMNRAGLPSIDFADRSRLPRVGAVYFVFEGDYLLYIGRSCNIRQRWLNNWHDKYALLCEREAITIAWFETADVKTLERRLILVLKPPLNRFMPRKGQSATTSCTVQLTEKMPEVRKRGEFGVDWLVCKCKRCGYKWISRKGVPQVCANPKCHSPIWEKPKGSSTKKKRPAKMP